MPNSRSVRCAYVVALAIAACSASVARAVLHIGCSSRGGPGSTTTVGPGLAAAAGATTSPGAVPTGSSTVAPARDHRLLASGRA